MHLLLEQPSELPVDEPWYQVSKADPALKRVWSYAQGFCCGQLFRDQESGLLKPESSVLRDPLRGLNFVRIGLVPWQVGNANAKSEVMAWRPIPLQLVEPCIPSHRQLRRQKSHDSRGWTCRHSHSKTLGSG